MKKLFIILALVVLVSALTLGGCAQQASTSTPTPEAKVIKIGVIYGLTGSGSEQQLMERDVAQLCADWLNDKGGITINGEKYKIKLVVEDNKMSPAGAVDAATKLVYQDKVNFVVGCVIPVQVEAVAGVTEKNKVLYVAGRTAQMRNDQPYTFTSNYGFTAPIPFLYDVLLEKYPTVKSIGFIAEDETGAMAIRAMSTSVAKKRGLETLAPIIHPWQKMEYSPDWVKIMNNNPDAVDQGLKMPANTANCIKQGRELGYKGPIIAAIPGDPNLIIKMVGDKALATDFIYAGFDPYGPDSPPVVKEMIKLWEAKYKTPLDADAPEAWDPVWCLAQAIEKAQSLDSTAVKNAWESMTTFETAKGTAKLGGEKTFGINHMVFNPCSISQLVDGKVVYTKWVDPWVP